MRASFMQRRNGNVAVNAQLKRDVDSYNDNNVHGAHVQMSFDYTEDLLDLEASDQYPSSSSEGSSDEDEADEV